MFNCWEILGISPTKNKRDIQRAYAGLVKQYHPEEYPEKFKAIQQAYKSAIASLDNVAHEQVFFSRSDEVSLPDTPDTNVFVDENVSSEEQMNDTTDYSNLEADEKYLVSVFQEEFSEDKVSVFLSDMSFLIQPLPLSYLSIILEQAVSQGLFEEDGFSQRLDAHLLSMRWKGKSSDRQEAFDLVKRYDLPEFANRVAAAMARENKALEKKEGKTEKSGRSSKRSILIYLWIILVVIGICYKVARLSSVFQEKPLEVVRQTKTIKDKSDFAYQLDIWLMMKTNDFSVVEEDGKYYLKHEVTKNSYELLGVSSAKVDYYDDLSMTSDEFSRRLGVLVSDENGYFQWLKTSEDIMAYISTDAIKTPLQNKYDPYIDHKLLEKQDMPTVYGAAESISFAEKVTMVEDLVRLGERSHAHLETISQVQWDEDVSDSEESSSGSSMTEKHMVTYDVKGDELVHESGDVSAEDDAKVKAHFMLFTRLVPAAYRQNISKFEIFTHPDLYGYVDFADSKTAKQVLKWNYRYLVTPSSKPEAIKRILTLSLAELGLIFTRDVQQTLHGRSYFSPLGETFDGFTENAYLNRYYQSFWSKVSPYYIDNHFKQEEDVQAFYDLNEDKFFSIDSALSPYNDFSRAFMLFVLTPVPSEGGEPYFDKIRFFYQYKELVELRAELLQNMVAILENP